MTTLVPHRFPAVSKEDWLAQVRKDLKDSAPADSLRWLTPDGFPLDPYYTAEDLTSLPLATIQAAQKSHPGWLNTPAVRTDDDRTTNSRLRDALAGGADALLVTASTQTNLPQLLNGLKLSDTPVFFRLDGNATAFLTSLRSVAPYQLKGGLLYDVIAHRLLQPDAPTDPWTDLADAGRLTTDSPHFRPLCASGHVFHNAGATATQELAFLLGGLAEQYDALTDRGLTVAQLAAQTMLSVSVGTSYFFEIAKLRALRVLWQRFLTAYEPALTTTAFIHARTSTFYDARATPYTNLLRATTEAMAAVVGGCDALTVHPYDTVPGATGDRAFAERLARNVSILLKEEAHLDKVADPSAGSYYIDVLTHQLTEAAWALFLRVEAMGGLLSAFEAGFLRSELDQSYHAGVEAVRNGKVLVGVTKFRFDDPAQEPPGQAVADEPAPPLLPNRRLAAAFD